MSSVNPHYTFVYSQPEEYHYSHDSVFLARRVSEIISKENLPSSQILDLCAGCGVVGLDLLVHLKDQHAIEQIDFIEVQECYLEHFEKNISVAKSLLVNSPKLQFLNINYSSITENSKKYDVIVSNPPYFRLGQGTLSHSEFKNRCRFFIDSDFKKLIETIHHSLSATGKAFVLLKSLEVHGIDVETEFKNFGFKLNLKSLGKIRETGFYEISKTI